ncbi:Cupin 2 conserved barrel domain protein [Stanieria cyanosphaera PCC 7437]|uniref:Cupin 2 conserved barrel domain protein n=1 Tax=Stanieria cyanosphaera (strain ATCC 29371 / PCC 7437) TaxID=111780 RepID=K9XTF1_STAC7|nr:cupin domain-containing protein [Stanieria cyanosphaera]AFZ35813.1 Cupin 2 conserved barrel domain protein [Stanieria cyanosphaera PCC 7437]
MMTNTLPFSIQRTFDVEKLVCFSEEKAIVTEISITKHSSIAVWGVRPGQQVPAHTHPDGQDTWIVIRGELTYYLGDGQKKIISAGQVDVAEPFQVHGAINEGFEDAVFLSVYSAPSLKVISASP